MLTDGLQHLPMSPTLSLDSSDTDNAPSEQINDPAADEWRYAANNFAVRNTGTSMAHSKTENDLFTVSERPTENAVTVTDESSPTTKIEMGHRSHKTPLDEVSRVVSSLDKFHLIVNAFFPRIFIRIRRVDMDVSNVRRPSVAAKKQNDTQQIACHAAALGHLGVINASACSPDRTP